VQLRGIIVYIHGFESVSIAVRLAAEMAACFIVRTIVERC